MLFFFQRGKGKENSVLSSLGVKDVTLGKVLAEKNKNSDGITTLKLKSLPRAPSTHLQPPPIKPALHQPTHQQPSSKVQSKGTTTITNVKVQPIKPVFQTINRPLKANPESVSTQTRPISRPLNDNRNCKTELAKKSFVSAKQSEKNKPSVTRPYSTGNLVNRNATKTETFTMPIKSTRTSKGTLGTSGTKPVCAPSDTSSKKTLNRPGPLKADSSKTMQQKQTLNKEPNKKEFTVLQKSVPGISRPKSSQPAFFKTEVAGKSTNAASAGNKNAFTQPRRTTFQLSSKPTQFQEPHTLPRTTKSLNKTRVSEQLKTPKSTFKPDTNGVRTVPLEGRNKPTAAQEERL